MDEGGHCRARGVAVWTRSSGSSGVEAGWDEDAWSREDGFCGRLPDFWLTRGSVWSAEGRAALLRRRCVEAMVALQRCVVSDDDCQWARGVPCRQGRDVGHEVGCRWWGKGPVRAGDYDMKAVGESN